MKYVTALNRNRDRSWCSDLLGIIEETKHNLVFKNLPYDFCGVISHTKEHFESFTDATFFKTQKDNKRKRFGFRPIKITFKSGYNPWRGETLKMVAENKTHIQVWHKFSNCFGVYQKREIIIEEIKE